MRSGHSLAFQQFESIVSLIDIQAINNNDPEVSELIKAYPEYNDENRKAFKIDWKSESDWEETSVSEGSSLLIPIAQSEQSGIILKSSGYLESISSLSSYKILCDGTLVLYTEYSGSIAEERIWFITNNLRCRASTTKQINSGGIMQTSFASEVRQLKL